MSVSAKSCFLPGREPQLNQVIGRPMPLPDPTAARRQYLCDTARRKFPGFNDGCIDPIWDPLPNGPRIPVAHMRLEEAIRNVFAGCVPEHPAFNSQILFALRTFRSNNIAAMDIERDKARIGAVVRTVNDKRPKYRLWYSDGAIMHLHTLLHEYGQIRGGDLYEFPSIETIGHRREEAGLNRFDLGPTYERSPRKPDKKRAQHRPVIPLADRAEPLRKQIGQHLAQQNNAAGSSDGWRVQVDKPELRKRQLRTLNHYLDELCPEGSYFNRIRQELIHQVRSNGSIIDRYKQATERGRARGWSRFDGSVWVAGEIQSEFDGVVNGIRQMLRSARQNLAAAYGNELKQFSAEDALKIDRLVRTHRSLSERHVEQRFAFGRQSHDATPRAHVPEAVKQALVRRESRNRTNPIAKQWAEKCEETLSELLPYEGRKTLEKRLHLQSKIFTGRNRVLGQDRSVEFYSVGLDELHFVYWKQFRENSDLVVRFAEELDKFDSAWEGKLRAIPEGKVQNTDGVGSVSHKEQVRISGLAFQSEELISAAGQPGQQRLPFQRIVSRAPFLEKDAGERQEAAFNQRNEDNDHHPASQEPSIIPAHSETSRGLKRARCDDPIQEDSNASTGSALPMGSAGSDNQRQTKRPRRDDRSRERQRSSSR